MKPEPPLTDFVKVTALQPRGGQPALPETGWRSPPALLMVMAASLQLSFASYTALQYNFAYELLGFTGREIGIQQSVREIPGFLSFLAVFLLFLMREQALAYVSLFLLGLGVAVTGYFPSAMGFYFTTFIASVGYHYYETMNQSLTLQWLPKDQAPQIMGRILAVAGFAQLFAYGLIFLAGWAFDLSFATLFLLAGGATLIGVALMVSLWPFYPERTAQRKKLVLRKRYWLYYALTFMSGARRQIFLVFASWMMIERFGYAFHDIAALFFVNALVLMFVAPLIGKLIGHFGERLSLRFEYLGLICVFAAYAFVQNPYIAIGLYILDHALFAMAIAIKTYFQKIADPADIAATTGVAFTINHIAAVFIPVLFGLLWLISPEAVFLSGAAMATISLALAALIPHHPEPGREVMWFGRGVREEVPGGSK